MTAEQQLERSVLEGKERDELSAIAQAMSLKTNSRTKKADIIDQILDATGVTSGSGAAASNGDGEAGDANGAKPPRRSRSASSAAAVADSADDSVATASADAGDATSTSAAADSDGAGASGGATTATLTAEAPSSGDPGPAIFVEPPDLTTGTEPAPGRQNGHSGGGNQGNGGGQGGGGQGGQQGNRNRQNQNQNRNQNNQGNDEAGNRRSRRRRGRERTGGPGQGQGQGGELQGGGQDQSYTGELVEVKGMLDLRDEGYGFLRCDGYLASSKDVYVSISQARRFALRRGDYVEGACRPAGNNEKYPALLRIDSISGLEPEEARNRPRFEDLTPLFPDSRLHLEMPGDKDNLTARIVDLISPIGKGQRGMIVSPPKAGKTTVMKQIAHSIEANNPDVHLMVLLVDERPEEVTDMRRTVKGEVIASTFDRPADEHTQVAELAIERAKRLVEMGRDVVIILDGITRLARAYNLAAPATGRIMSGGVDSGALYPPKKFFGAARNIEEGGSLTILASALVETGSKMDEVIFEEFKGTGNMELRLDRRLSERRLYPAIDVNASSTRHEELLFERGQLQQVWKLRRVLNALASDGKDAAGLELLMDKIRTTGSNDEFLAEIAKGPGT
jgi:transcription termination factor Rho